MRERNLGAVLARWPGRWLRLKDFFGAPPPSAPVLAEPPADAPLIRPFPWEAHYPDGLVWDLDVSPRPLFELLDDAVAAWANRPCLDFLGRKSSYREIGQLVDRAAKGFQELGVKPGVRVGLFLPNCPYYVICFFAVLKAGGTIVNYNPLYAEREIARQIEDSGTSIMVTLNIKAHVPQGRPSARGHLPREDRGRLHGRPPALARAHPVRRAAPQGDRRRRDRRPSRPLQEADRQRRQVRAGRDRPGPGRRGAPVHRRHDRPAQGRHAHPRRPLYQYAAGQHVGGRQPTRHGKSGRRATAVPRVRHDRGDERRHRRRLRDHPAAALSPGSAAQGDCQGARHGAAGRADHVLGDQRLHAAGSVRPVQPAPLHLRWRAPAARGAGHVRAADRMHAGRGLRPDRGRAGVHDQSVRRGAPGLDRPATARNAGRDHRDRRPRSPSADRPARRDLRQRPAGHGRATRDGPRRPQRPCAAAACTPGMSATSTRTATSI